MKTKYICKIVVSILVSVMFVSCCEDYIEDKSDISDIYDLPQFVTTPIGYSIDFAPDMSQVGIIKDNKDIYWEMNDFDNKVVITYSEEGAQIESTNSGIITHVSNGYVTVDFLTNNLSGIEIELRGGCSDGGLKIYGNSKFKLTLNNVKLHSNKSAVINNQCKKRMFLVLTRGSRNEISDSENYVEEDYYYPGKTSVTEDRKGALFSEGNIIISGGGILEVEGNARHGIATDGYFVMRPGTSVGVKKSISNAIQAKGDLREKKGVEILGGRLYAFTDSKAGKGIKTDNNLTIAGGKIVVNTCGDAIYEEDVHDTSSAACLKADGKISISGGSISLRAEGKGGKGVNTSDTLSMSGGKVEIAVLGARYEYADNIYTSSKGVKADKGLYISGGEIKVACIGKSKGSEAFSTDADVSINGGKISLWGYDEGCACNKFSLTDGVFSVMSISTYALKADAQIDISGGELYAFGNVAPYCGIYCGDSSQFTLKNAKCVSLGGAQSTLPTTGNYFIIENLSLSAGENITMTDNQSGKDVSFTAMRSYNKSRGFWTNGL